MKISLLIIAGLVMMSAVMAQSPKVTWGHQPYDKDDDFILLGKGPDEKTIAIRVNKKIYFLETLDSSNNPLTSKIIEPPTELKALQDDFEGFSEILFLKTKVCLIPKYFNKKQKLTQIFAYEISLDGEIISSCAKVFEINGNPISSEKYVMSGVNGKFSFIFEVVKQKGFAENEFRTRIYDRDLNLLKSTDFNIPTPDEGKFNQLYLEKSIITDAGNVYFLADKIKKQVIISLGVWRYDFSRDRLDEVNLPPAFSELSATLFFYSSADQTRIVGFYNETGDNSDYSPYKGIFHAVINDESLELEKLKMTEIPSGVEIVPQSKDIMQKNRSIVLKQNGGVVMLSESYYSYKSNETMGPILIADLDDDGGVRFFNTIHKHQALFHGIGRRPVFGFCSFYDNYHKELKIVFNGSKGNLLAESDATARIGPFNLKSMIPILESVNEAGEITKELLINNATVSLCPQSAVRLSDGKFVLIGLEESKPVLGNLIFPK